MNAIAIGMWCGPAPVTENIDMSTPDKAGITFKAICSLVFTIGLLAGLPGTAGAQVFGGGVIDFCNDDPATGKPYYDNATPQTFGSFTDLNHSGWRPPNPATVRPRPPQINMFRNMHTTTNPAGTNPWGDSVDKPDKCALNFYGDALYTSNNHAEMWITILAAPGSPPPMTGCWGLTATVWYDDVGKAPNPQGNGGWNNGKAVGIVTNFNPANSTGLFLGMFDSGNTERLDLLTFDASPNPPNNMINPVAVASTALKVNSVISTGSSQFFSLAYVMTMDICTGPDGTGTNRISAIASMQPAVSLYSPPGTCPDDRKPDQQCLVYNGLLPAGIIASGAVGLATLAPTSGAGVVDTYVSRFTFTGGESAPD
jgi:hypothetical protein